MLSVRSNSNNGESVMAYVKWGEVTDLWRRDSMKNGIKDDVALATCQPAVNRIMNPATDTDTDTSPEYGVRQYLAS